MARVENGDGGVDAHDPRLPTASLRPLAPGTYIVVWRVVSVDDASELWRLRLHRCAEPMMMVAKLTVFLVLVTLASLNRIRFTPRLVTGVAGFIRRLGWSVAIEAALGLAIVFLAAVLAATSTPRMAHMHRAVRHRSRTAKKSGGGE
jgi:hypothetical protein